MSSSGSGEFKSKWLQFCAFLNTRSLKYLRTEVDTDGLVYFIFADPDGEAAGLEFQFSMGAQVAAIELFGSVNFLRKQMTLAKQGNQENIQNVVSSSHSR
jgi:hypothetical protein